MTTTLQRPQAAHARVRSRGHGPGTSPAKGGTSAQTTPAPVDAFPRTKRPLPWIVAGFLAMLFFIPIDSTQVKVHLPVGSQIDRFAIALMVFAWIWFGGDQRAFLRTRRSKLFVGAAFVYFSLAVASVLLDNGRIINLGQLTLAEKRFALLASFMILSWFTLSALRYEDVRGFTTYLIGLGSITAVGIIIERRTGYNVFYNFSGVLLKPIASVASSPTVIHPAFGSDGRVVVVGPTLHGLAAATMMVVVFPFAFVRLLDAPSRRSWWLNALACMLLFAAAMSTEKKTALLVPIAAVIYVAIYRRRQIMRLAVPGVLVLVVVVHLASPHSLGILTNISGDASSNSTAHRLGDFSDLAPDIDAHPVFGRGFGTIDPDQPDQYRINDNEYLDELWEVGAAGLLAYIGMILAPVILARRAIRTGERERASLALAGSAGCVAFLVVSALFDALSYPQAPYMFFLVAALTTIAAAGPEGNIVPSRRLKLSRAIDPGL